MKIGVAQVNPTVGDLDGNATKIANYARQAAKEGADLCVFGSGALTGAPLAGLERHAAFMSDALAHLQELGRGLEVLSLVSCPIDVGAYPYASDGPSYADKVDADAPNPTYANALFILGDDDDPAQLLYAPDFEPEGSVPILDIAGGRIPVILDGHFNQGLKLDGAAAIIEIASDAYTAEFAAPAALGTLSRPMTISRACQTFVVTANLCGATDSTVFAGNSLAFAPRPRLLHAAAVDEEELFVFSTDDVAGTRGAAGDARLEGAELLWRGIEVATRDYVRKNGFTDVVVGLSGGIDSSVVATVAADALGAEHVHGVLMPGPYSSEGSVTDARELAANLGIETIDLPIGGPLDALRDALADACGGSVDGVAAENLQARIRAVYLMTLANARGWLPLNTGNKSEAAMGFSTLGGDTAGVFAPIGQVYKTDVYGLAEWRAAQSESIPRASIEKAPSAELYEGATDQDRLPPYDKLDEVLLGHVEGGMGAAELAAAGHDPATVSEVLSTTTSAEFKRRLEPLGPKVMGLDLTSDRAWPITCAWRDGS